MIKKKKGSAFVVLDGKRTKNRDLGVAKDFAEFMTWFYSGGARSIEEPILPKTQKKKLQAK